MEATGGFSFSWSAFTYKLWQQKLRLLVVKMDVASVLKPGVPIRVVKRHCGEQQKTVKDREGPLNVWGKGVCAEANSA